MTGTSNWWATARARAMLTIAIQSNIPFDFDSFCMFLMGIAEDKV